jgi:hypothetical protein
MIRQLEAKVAGIANAVKSVQNWISWGFVVVAALVLLVGR